MSKGSETGRATFHTRKTEFCPSCLDRDAINLVGRPRYRRGMPLTFGCETCDGKGYVVLPDHRRADPYFIKERVRVGT